MKSSFRSRSLAILLAGVAFASCIGAGLVEAARSVRRWVLDIPAVFDQPMGLKLHDKPAVQMVQACAHATKLAKRERPRLFEQWRMCPSA